MSTSGRGMQPVASSASLTSLHSVASVSSLSSLGGGDSEIAEDDPNFDEMVRERQARKDEKARIAADKAAKRAEIKKVRFSKRF